MNRKNPASPAVAGNIGLPNVHFKGVTTPSDDFASVQNQLRSKPAFYELDLSTARSIAAGSHVVIGAAANSFYVDGNTDVGNASVHFQSDIISARTPPIYVGPQFIARIPFVALLIENLAQPGKVLRFVYGVDIDFVPGANNQLSIAGNVSVQGPRNMLGAQTLADQPVIINNAGYNYGAAFASTTAFAANTPVNIIAAGSNVAGYILHDGQAFGVAAGAPNFSFLAKATAPANVLDGDVLAIASFTGSGPIVPINGLGNPRRVAAGKRLDAILAVAATSNFYFANYTLLT